MGVGQLRFGLTQWGILSVLALVGGAELVGELGFALAIVTHVYQLARLRLRDVLISWFDSVGLLNALMRRS